ncbi:MAG: AAA family ATPase, partial [Cyanobacteria bacterium J06559_1]
DGQLKQWKQSLVQALGTDAQVMVDMLPELANIVGEQPEVTELSGSEAQARFHRVLNQFVGVFARQQHPLVLFLDDLQWADAASLNLLQVLTRPEQSDCLLVLGAYRDNEVFAGHPFMLTLSELHKQKTQVHTLTLSPLAESEVEQLVADAMRCPSDLAKPLAQLMYQQAQGNPFFTTQFLQTLQAQGCLAYDIELGHWQCDLSQIRRQSLTEDVVSFMVSRLQALPAETQRVLKLAACLGNQFELEILAVICEQSIEATAADLWVSLQEGFVIPENETYRFFQQDLAQSATDLAVTCPTVSYRFLHDRVQQAAYLLIAEEQRANIHYEIGQKLLAHLNQQAKEEALFEIVNHLNFGQGLVGQGLSDTSLETTELAQLNLAAGERAIASTAYTAAAKYLESGIA